ncbi:MAG TPA: DUF6585 family protein [Candidatus Sulfotelmatobacter sp.]|nr:DUF6585 family protein [Candidatus Sulfotelmatobacter sp.]
MKALGAPIRHFGFNRLWAAFFAVGVLMFGALGVATLTFMRKDSEWWEPVVGVSLCCLNIYVLARTMKTSATVCESGIRYTGLKGAGEMLWDEVDKFRFAILITRHQGIIKTTQYTTTLVSSDGRRVELGSNVQQPKELADLLVKTLQPILLRKTIAAYDSGKIVDLGAIRVTRECVSVSTGLRTVNIPTANVLACGIDQGMVIVSERKDGKLKNHAASMQKVDNAFALLELINTKIVQHSFAASGAR